MAIGEKAMYRRYLPVAILLVFTGCGGGGSSSGDQSSRPAPDPSPTPGELCSRNAIEAGMDAHLQTVETDSDFALFLERGDGQSYDLVRGGASLQTAYASASTSKLVAATVILWVVDAGFLSLEDTPQRWLPDWPLANDPTLSNITLDHLLGFTSGLQEEALCINLPNANFFDCVTAIGENNAGNGAVPGNSFHYASGHLQVAGAMAINAGGYADWTELFDGFRADTGLFPTSRFDLPSLNNPRLAGGMHWTGEEYINFLRAYRNQRILTPALSNEALKDHTSTAAFSYSPAFERLGEQWHYGFGLWHECFNVSFNCEAAETISSPGAYGAYPFINYRDDFFGIIAREGDLGTLAEGLALYRSLRNQAEAWAGCVNP